MTLNYLRHGFHAILIALLGVMAVQPSSAQHVLSIRDADIQTLIDDVSVVTGYTFIVHPAVQGNVTVTSQTPMTTREVFGVFLATLRVQGFTAVPAGANAYKIIPVDEAVTDAAFMSADRAPGDQFVTEVIRFENFSALEAAKMLRPVVHPRGQISGSTDSNIVIVTDYAGNLRRVREMAHQLDADAATTRTVALIHVSAVDMANAFRSLDPRVEGAGGTGLRIVAVGTGNSVMLRGTENDVAEAEALIRSLDRPSPVRMGTRVIRLKHATAEDLLPVLESVGTALVGVSAPGEGVQGSGGLTIATYMATNALILTGEEGALRAAEEVIRQLDVRRPQVLVEAIIVDLSDSTVRELGLELVLSGNGTSSVPFAATNFTRSAPNLLALTGAVLINDGTQVSDTLRDAALTSLLGVDGFIGGFGGEIGDDGLFGIILNAANRDVASNVLSTPSVVTLDNETAALLVGQEIPITTGEALGSANTNPFRTIERKDVGIELTVTPQVGEDGTIRLVIVQEVSSVVGPVGSGSSELITNKRSLSTTVLADDGQIIVLGGLIQDEATISESRVPFLSDIPGVGEAFKSRGRSGGKTNLMVFLRPTILRDAETMRAVSDRRMRYISSQPGALDINLEQRVDDLVDGLTGTAPRGN
jgi:general secretion pathway protein D